MLVSIIIPIFNEEDSLPFLITALKKLKNITDYSYEFILIDDGSRDQSFSLIKGYSKVIPEIKYISFSRNFGKEAAILAGLEKSTGDLVGLMDADLQHPPELIPQMIEELLTSPELDVVATRRSQRKWNSKSYSFLAKIFYKGINFFSKDIHLEVGAQDFRFMKKRVVTALLKIRENNRFSKGLFSWVGFETKWIEVEDQKRVAGSTKWSFWDSVSYAIDGILSFSIAPLRFSLFIGSASAALGFLYALYIVIDTLINGKTLPGYASLICILLFLGGLILLSLGILGEYIGRIYAEVKNRPHYIVKESSYEED